MTSVYIGGQKLTSMYINGADRLESGGVITTIAPSVSGLTLLNVGPTSMNAAWTYSGGSPDESYYIQIRTSTQAEAGQTGITINLSPGATSYFIQGLTPETIYFINVYAVNSAGSDSDLETTVTDGLIQAPDVSQLTFPESEITANSITVQWAYSGSDPDTYTIRYGTEPTIFQAVGGTLENLSVGQTEAVISGLTIHETYYFRVDATNTSGTNRGTGIQATSIGSIEAPVISNVRGINIADTTATFTWDYSGGAPDTYTIRWGDSSQVSGGIGGTLVNLSAGQTTYDISGLNPDTNYFARIDAVNLNDSAFSTGLLRTEDEVDTSFPVISNLVIPSIDSDSVLVSWDIDYNEGTPTEYYIRYGTSTAVYSDIGGTVVNESYPSSLETIEGLESNTTYYFYVFAGNQYGSSSLTGSATTQAATATSHCYTLEADADGGSLGTWFSYELAVAGNLITSYEIVDSGETANVCSSSLPQVVLGTGTITGGTSTCTSNSDCEI